MTQKEVEIEEVISKMNIKLKQKQIDTTDNALKEIEHKSFF